MARDRRLPARDRARVGRDAGAVWAVRLARGYVLAHAGSDPAPHRDAHRDSGDGVSVGDAHRLAGDASAHEESDDARTDEKSGDALADVKSFEESYEAVGGVVTIFEYER